MTPSAYTPSRRIFSQRNALLASCAAVALAALAPAPAMAQVAPPTGAFQGSIQTYSGTVTRTPTSNTQETITIGSPTATINWSPTDNAIGGGAINFLPTGNVATFTSTPGITDYTVLNRIVPTDTSRAILLDGSVIATLEGTSAIGGNIWFYSPGGILIGSNAVFDVGGLLLSSLDIANGWSTGTSGFSASFSKVATSAGPISISPGASITATGTNSYVAVVAPRIEQGGNVQSGRSVAYAAGEQLSMTMTDGLFDIQVDIGTDDANGIVHTGNTVGITDGSGVREIALVAVPKTTAMQMLLQGGTTGFRAADGASVQNGLVVLSAGHGISHDSLGFPHFDGSELGRAAGGPAADISIQGGHYTSGIEASATGSIYAGANGGSLIVDGDVGLLGLVNASLLVGAGETVQIAGSLAVMADDMRSFDNGSLGYSLDAAGGNAQVGVADGGSLTVGGFLFITAYAKGGGDVLGASAGNALGGQALLWTSGSGSVSVGGDAYIAAAGVGGNGAGQGGSGEGGLAQIRSNGPGSIHIAGSAFLNSDGRGGSGQSGGDGFGGTSYSGHVGGAGIDGFDGTIAIAGSIGISATGRGGAATVGYGGSGGDGRGGVGWIEARGNSGAVPATTSTITGGDSSIDASGYGGAGGASNGVDIAAGSGGTGTGGTYNGQLGSGGAFAASANGATLHLGNVVLTAAGSGGAGGSGAGTMAGGAGGDAVGGTAEAGNYGPIGTPSTATYGNLTLSGSAFGGDGGLGGSGQGFGGSATAGSAFIYAVGNVSAGTVNLTADAWGGDGSIGGNALGGTAQVASWYDSGSTLDIAGNAWISSYASGGSGDVGGNATGGYSGLAALGGAVLNVGGYTTLTADAVGGAGVSQGGSGTGGSSELTADAATVAIHGIGVVAQGTGGAASNAGGTGTGGDITLSVTSGGSLDARYMYMLATGYGGASDLGPAGSAYGGSFTGTIAGAFNAGTMIAFADAIGGISTSGAGGSADAGIANLTIDGGHVSVSGNGYLTADALAGAGATGGSATGGSTAFDISSNGGSASFTYFEEHTQAHGGDGSNGAGGDAVAGTSTITIAAPASVETMSSLTADKLYLDAQASAGDGTGGVGGNASAGTALASLDGGSTTIATSITVLASATAGKGTSGGNASGGTAMLFAGSVFDAADVLVTAFAGGGEGTSGYGGNASGGIAEFASFGSGHASVSGTTAVRASAVGGAGSSGGGDGFAGSAAIWADSGGTLVLGNSSIRAIGTGGSSSGGAGGNGQGGYAEMSSLDGTSITASQFEVDTSGTGGGGGNGGSGGDGQGGSIAINSWGVYGPTTVSIGAVSLLADGHGGAGGAGASGGAGGAGGAGSGGYVNMNGTAAGGTLSVGDTLASVQGFGGDGASGGANEAGSGGSGGAGGAGTGGQIQLGTVSVSGATGAGGTTTFRNVSADASAFGGAGGAGGTGSGGAGAGGNGGAASGGAALFLARGVLLTANDVLLEANATGGNGGGGSVNGNGGNASTGWVAVESKDRYGHPDQRGSLVANSITGNTVATGGTGAVNGTSTVMGGSYFRLLNGDATIGSVAFNIAGDLYDNSSGETYVSVRDGAATIAGNFTFNTTGDLILDASNGSMGANAIALTAGDFIADSVNPAPTAPGTYSANSLTIVSGQDFVTDAVLAGSAINVSAAGMLTMGDVGATSSATFSAGGLARFLGTVSAPTITVTSSDIEIDAGARLGVGGTTQLLTFNAVSGNGAPVIIGDSATAAQPGQYVLNEAGGINANQVIVNALAAGTGPAPDVIIHDLHIEGSATPGGGVSWVALNTGGSILIDGMVDFTDAGSGDSMVLTAGNRIEVNTDTGGFQMTDANQHYAGTLVLNATDVWVGDGSLLSQLEQDWNFAGRKEALASNNGPVVADGYVRAGGITVVAGNSFFVQNSGTATDTAGVTVGDGGLIVVGASGGSQAATAAAVSAAVAAASTETSLQLYGQQLKSDGTSLRGADFVKAVTLSGTFTSDSAINGGLLTPPPPPTSAIASDSVLGPVSTPASSTQSPQALSEPQATDEGDSGASEEKSEEKKEKDKEKDKDSKSSTDSALYLYNPGPLRPPTTIDQPITSGSDYPGMMD